MTIVIATSTQFISCETCPFYTRNPSSTLLERMDDCSTVIDLRPPVTGSIKRETTWLASSNMWTVHCSRVDGFLLGVCEVFKTSSNIDSLNHYTVIRRRKLVCIYLYGQSLYACKLLKPITLCWQPKMYYVVKYILCKYILRWIFVLLCWIQCLMSICSCNLLCWWVLCFLPSLLLIWSILRDQGQLFLSRGQVAKNFTHFTPPILCWLMSGFNQTLRKDIQSSRQSESCLATCRNCS